uniref:Uncharacterized protein n=1 Tax=Strongyloides venezuelensis TaxID=75913 RepID=A0A0K0EU14_STRVS
MDLKNGVDKWRCCVDTRALNKLLILQQIALPTFGISSDRITSSNIEIVRSLHSLRYRKIYEIDL